MRASADDRDTSGDALPAQARVWLRLLASGEVKASDAEAFQRWLHTSEAHRAAFQEVKQRWAALRPVSGEYLRTRPAAAAAHERARQGRSFGRRAFLGAAVSAAAVAGVAVVAYPSGGLWPAAGEDVADERTGVGEQRTLALASRVQVTLNTQTRIRRERVAGQFTGIDLLSGEAAIDLLAEGGPFGVVAGAGHSLAHAGRFEVRHLDGKVCVTCIEGALRIEHPAGVRALQAGQQAVYDARSLSGIARVALDKVSAWRRGELVFDQARLAEVLAEIDRYRAGRVLLVNAAAGEKRVSGRFRLASLDSALAQLEHTFGLRARSLPGGLLLLS
jgi:transmembrane sensor